MTHGPKWSGFPKPRKQGWLAKRSIPKWTLCEHSWFPKGKPPKQGSTILGHGVLMALIFCDNKAIDSWEGTQWFHRKGDFPQPCALVRSGRRFGSPGSCVFHMEPKNGLPKTTRQVKFPGVDSSGCVCVFFWVTPNENSLYCCRGAR